MGADFQEITLSAAPLVPTGHFAMYVFPVGLAGGPASVQLVLSSAFQAATASVTPLGAGATFNSTSVDLLSSPLSFAEAMAFSDQASAVNGFMIQQSIDNANWDLNSAVASVLANTGLGIKAAIVARHVRISYTNGAAPQTTFRLGGRFSLA